MADADLKKKRARQRRRYRINRAVRRRQSALGSSIVPGAPVPALGGEVSGEPDAEPNSGPGQGCVRDVSLKCVFRTRRCGGTGTSILEDGGRIAVYPPPGLPSGVGGHGSGSANSGGVAVLSSAPGFAFPLK